MAIYLPYNNSSAKKIFSRARQLSSVNCHHLRPCSVSSENLRFSTLRQITVNDEIISNGDENEIFRDNHVNSVADDAPNVAKPLITMTLNILAE